MRQMELMAELTAIVEFSAQTKQKVTLLNLIAEKYEYRDDLDAQMCKTGLRIEAATIKAINEHLENRLKEIKKELNIPEE